MLRVKFFVIPCILPLSSRAALFCHPDVREGSEIMKKIKRKSLPTNYTNYTKRELAVGFLRLRR